MEPARRHDPLTRAAIRHGPDKYGAHLYTPIYNTLFAHLREAPIRLFEIGVGGYAAPQAGGLSLRMWAEFFPYAEITALDIHPKSLSLPPRVTIVQGSQTDEAVLARITRERGPFDIVIDDASHHVDHVLGTFALLYPLIADNGFYVIEDTQTSFSPTFAGRPDGKGTIFDLANRLSLAMHSLEGYADPAIDPKFIELGKITHAVTVYRNIVVIQRGANTYPSNFRFDIANDEVREVFDAITAEARLNPSPGAALSRIEMLLCAGQSEAAAQLACEAADAYPHDVSLLHELMRLVERARSERAQAAIASRLAKTL